MVFRLSSLRNITHVRKQKLSFWSIVQTVIEYVNIGKLQIVKTEQTQKFSKLIVVSSIFLHSRLSQRFANICCYFESESCCGHFENSDLSNRTKFNLFTFLFTHSINVNSKSNRNLSDFWSNNERQIAANVRASSVLF